MRSPFKILVSLFSVVLLATGLGCPEEQLTGECTSGIEFSDEAAIIPSDSPFVMCPVTPVAPDNKVYGNLLLSNCGRTALSISAATISNDESPEVFSDLQLETKEIAAGETSALRFTYEAVDTAEHHGKITIKSNASNFAELSIDVVVRADEPFDGGFCPPVGDNLDAGSAD